MMGLSGFTVPHTIGRKTDHLLASLSDDQSFKVRTGADGSAFVLINPNASFAPAMAVGQTPGNVVVAGTLTHLPYYSCSIISNTVPYSSLPYYNFAGPYINYASQALGTASDATVI